MVEEKEIPVPKPPQKNSDDEGYILIPKKIAAIEAHLHVLAGRNIAIIGICGIVLTVLVMIVSKSVGAIVAAVGCTVLGFMAVWRVKKAEYLEEKYNLDKKPLFKNFNTGGFK